MKVIVIYGSPNDKPFMEPAREYFAQENVPYEETVLSAHRDLPELIRFLGDLEASGEKAVILAVAGLSAALPGVVVMSCSLPVIGVPVPGGPLNGIDALLAIAQCPGATIPAPTLHFTRRQMAIYLCVLALSLLWLLAGGMTGITSQHADFVVRNPIYETLIRCDWPLVDAGGRPFIYYLAFWLPPALACKCFSCSDIFIINYVLTAWTGLGLALTLTVLWSKFRTATLLFLLLLIFQGPLDGIVRWGLHLFHLQGPLAHELYLTVLAFFGGVPPTMQLHNTFHHTTLLWLFLSMAAAWDIPPKNQLFLASLCLLASPIGSLGLLVFIAVSTLFCLALLFTRIFSERMGPPRWRRLCVCYLILAALPSLSVFAKAAPTLALTKPARLANMQREWKGHLHHPAHPWNAPLWGTGEGRAFRNIYFQKAGQSAEGPLAPFSTGIKTDAEPAAAPRP